MLIICQQHRDNKSGTPRIHTSGAAGSKARREAEPPAPQARGGRLLSGVPGRRQAAPQGGARKRAGPEGQGRPKGPRGKAGRRGAALRPPGHGWPTPAEPSRHGMPGRRSRRTTRRGASCGRGGAGGPPSGGVRRDKGAHRGLTRAPTNLPAMDGGDAALTVRRPRVAPLAGPEWPGFRAPELRGPTCPLSDRDER